MSWAFLRNGRRSDLKPLTPPRVRANLKPSPERWISDLSASL